MIYTTFSQLNQYRGLSQNLDTAIDAILQGKLDDLQPGRNGVDGDKVFIMSFQYETMTQADCFFEAHRQYGDIHIILEGQESIGITDLDRLHQVDEDVSSDFIKLEGDIDVLCPLTPGVAAVVFPQDAHMVKRQLGSKQWVRKAVVKFQI